MTSVEIAAVKNLVKSFSELKSYYDQKKSNIDSTLAAAEDTFAEFLAQPYSSASIMTIWVPTGTSSINPMTIDLEEAKNAQIDSLARYQTAGSIMDFSPVTPYPGYGYYSPMSSAYSRMSIYFHGDRYDSGVTVGYIFVLKNTINKEGFGGWQSPNYIVDANGIQLKNIKISVDEHKVSLPFVVENVPTEYFNTVSQMRLGNYGGDPSFVFNNSVFITVHHN